MTDTDVAIVGAGAAGLAAARTLTDLGVPFVLLEASHRIGGRAYTEEVSPGVPFDLGCHWLHSASLNPFVAIADSFGFHYNTQGISLRIRLDGAWASETVQEERDAFFERNLDLIAQAGERGRDVAIAEATERDSRWTAPFDYFISLMASADADRVSALDYHNYNDTGENWALKEGYGALVARFGADVPVTLNAAVARIGWSGKTLRLTTPQGEVRAKKVIVTVSTGVLGA